MIDCSTKEITIPRTKNDEAVSIPLNDDVIQALRTLPSWSERSGPIFSHQRHPGQAVKSNDHWFKKALKSAKIDDFKWHHLRHTFASWLIQGKCKKSCVEKCKCTSHDRGCVPLERVARLLGHRGLTMTLRYAHLAPNQLHADVASLVRSPISTPVAQSLSQKS